MDSTVMITVWTGSAPPPPLESLRMPELAHLDVFTSRSSEDGRSRYRLHLGYFADSRAAKQVLPRVREVYPLAWVVPADRHRPLGRLKTRALPTAPLESATPVAAGGLVERIPPVAPIPPIQAALPPKSVQAVQVVEAVAPQKMAALKPFARQDLSAEMTDEISLDMVAILALLNEEYDPPSEAAADPSAQDSARRTPTPVTAAPPPAFREAFHALSRLIVEEWQADKPIIAGSPDPSWLKRLPRLIRGSKSP